MPDNNATERGMRAVASARKNALFTAHDAGAEDWAVIASLIETCKLNGVDPHAGLTDTLAHIPEYKITKVDDLLPWCRNR